MLPLSQRPAAEKKIEEATLLACAALLQASGGFVCAQYRLVPAAGEVHGPSLRVDASRGGHYFVLAGVT